MLTTYENAHNLCNAHTTYENAHNLRKCSYNLQKCSQPTKMLTTCANAHNLRKCSQLANMLTTENQYYNLQKCSHLSENAHEKLVHKCASSPSLCLTRNAYNTQFLQCCVLAKHVRPSPLPMGMISMAEKGHSILLYCHSAPPVELDHRTEMWCTCLECMVIAWNWVIVLLNSRVLG